MENAKALIVIGGDPPLRDALVQLHGEHRIICADSGLDHAYALGLEAHDVVGDMDSVSEDALLRARAHGALIHTADPAKDETDFELALSLALANHSDEIAVLWGGGDRADHSLGIYAALAHPRLDACSKLRLFVGAHEMHIVRPHRPLALDAAEGTTVSLTPLAGHAHGVVATGLRWPLDGETLLAHQARGVSNVSTGRFSVALVDGVLAVTLPILVQGVRP